MILAAIAQRMARSALSLIAAGKYTIEQVARKVIDKFGPIQPQDVSRVHLIVRQQQSAAMAGQQLAVSLSAPGTTAGLPIDWSLNGQSGKYGYRVVVTVTDPTTGESYDTIVYVTSNTPMSGQGILDAAQPMAESFARIGSVTNPSAAGSSPSSVDMRIISAGRVP